MIAQDVDQASDGEVLSGAAAFATLNGLVAEGVGTLEFVRREPELFEFRHGAELFAPLHRGELGLFVIRARLGSGPARILGAYESSLDARSRAGYRGVAIALDEVETPPRDAALNYLSEFMGRLRSAPPDRSADRLRFFPDDQAAYARDAAAGLRLTPLAETGVMRLGWTEGKEASAVEALRCLWGLSWLPDHPNRIVALPQSEVFARPLDAAMIRFASESFAASREERRRMEAQERSKPAQPATPTPIAPELGEALENRLSALERQVSRLATDLSALKSELGRDRTSTSFAPTGLAGGAKPNSAGSGRRAKLPSDPNRRIGEAPMKWLLVGLGVVLSIAIAGLVLNLVLRSSDQASPPPPPGQPSAAPDAARPQPEPATLAPAEPAAK